MKIEESFMLKSQILDGNMVTLKKGQRTGMCKPVIRVEENVPSRMNQVIYKKFSEILIKTLRHFSENEMLKALEFFKEKASIFANGKIANWSELVQHQINTGDHPEYYHSPNTKKPLMS